MARLLEGPRADLDPDPLPLGPFELAEHQIHPAQNRPVSVPIDQRADACEIAERDFRRLSMETAQRTVRFWQLHNKIEK